MAAELAIVMEIIKETVFLNKANGDDVAVIKFLFNCQTTCLIFFVLTLLIEFFYRPGETSASIIHLA
ncbi:hypothetical protein BK025_12455 [Sodalis sp. TME1]|nr:hypothetical protein BK025_12455 [Sodalis sp. TME1]